MTAQPLQTLLPRIEPERAALQTRVITALDGIVVAEMRLHAAVLDTPPLAAIGCAGGWELTPLLTGGTIPALLGDDGQPDALLAVAALGGLEPLVAAVESGLGVSLSPDSIGLASAPLWLRIDALDVDGDVRHALALGLDTQAVFELPKRHFTRPAFAGALRLAFVFIAAAPRLAPERIAQLAHGDIVLIGQSLLPGTLQFGGQSHSASYRPAAALVTIADFQGIAIVSDLDTQKPLDPALQLPLTVEIAGGTAALETLANLAPGSVLPLGIAGSALPVTLSAAGARIATGELVAIGDAYGVLITRRLG